MCYFCRKAGLCERLLAINGIRYLSEATNCIHLQFPAVVISEKNVWYQTQMQWWIFISPRWLPISPRRSSISPGPTFIKPDQLDPWIKDQIKITLLSTIALLQLPNFVSCGKDKPSHMTQNLITVGTELWTAERFLVDPWSMVQADLVW